MKKLEQLAPQRDPELRRWSKRYVNRYLRRQARRDPERSLRRLPFRGYTL